MKYECMYFGNRIHIYIKDSFNSPHSHRRVATAYDTYRAYEHEHALLSIQYAALIYILAELADYACVRVYMWDVGVF